MARIIVGALIGAIIGILFAPRRGQETRDQLMAQLQDLYSQSSGRIEEQRERVSEVVSSGREAAAKRGEELRQRIDETRAKVIDMVKRGEEKLPTVETKSTPDEKEIELAVGQTEIEVEVEKKHKKNDEKKD